MLCRNVCISERNKVKGSEGVQLKGRARSKEQRLATYSERGRKSAVLVQIGDIYQESSFMYFMEVWLYNSVPDSYVTVWMVLNLFVKTKVRIKDVGERRECNCEGESSGDFVLRHNQLKGSQSLCR